MTNGRLRVLTVLAGLWCAGRVLAADATIESPFPETERASDQVKVELIVEHGSIQPGGKTRIGVQFAIENGWHIYAKEPGDAGLPTTVAWSGPWWVTFDPLQYPKPERFTDPGDIHTFGYHGAIVLASELRLIGGVKPGEFIPQRASVIPPSKMDHSIPIKATVKWLACREICIPGSATLSLTLPVSMSLPIFSAHAQLFEQLDP